MYSDVSRFSLMPHGIGAGLDGIDSAARRIGVSFIALATGTLTELKLVCNVTGTPTIRVDIFASDAEGVPTGASLGNTTTFAVGTNTTVSTVSALSVSVTLGTRYVAVFQNTHGTPGSNFISIATFAYTPHIEGWGWCYSDDTSATYRGRFQQPVPMSMLISAVVCGFANLRVNASGSNGVMMHTNNRSGVRIKPDTDTTISTIEAFMRVSGTFASAGAIQCEIWEGTTLLATSTNTQTTSTTTGQLGACTWLFPDLFIKAGKTICIMFKNTGGSASHGYYIQSSNVSTHTPVGVDTMVPWGYHSVAATTEPISAYTIPGATAQYWVRVNGKFVPPRHATRSGGFL